ncbi:hypothetical protein [Kytococcus sedentarius]|uniref:hypothetical protein n=1 Tax=Kytococcus sedentarius TaxID=1276 RepID=UPI00194EA146|nr:hypothetical protein [Kytococcus sedentarius]QRO87156.1 hypothetical protein I6J30_10090 [Kytococcus sedentarius]
MSLVLASLAATVSLLVAAMMVGQVRVADDHLLDRRPALSGEAAASWGKSMPVLPGGVGQIPIHWIQPDPGHEADPALVPPGLDRLPEPGSAVVSPGLARVGVTAEDLGMRTSDAGSGDGGTIGDDFLVSRSEGYAIARPPAGQSLAEDYSERVSGYGGGGPAERVFFVETVLDAPAGQIGLVGTLALLVLPALLLLGTAARAVSGVTQARAQRLWVLGVSRRAIRRVVLLETAVLTSLGALVGAVVWAVGLSWRTTWPGNDAVLIPASRVPLWIALPVVLLAVAVAALWAFTAPLAARGVRARPRVGDWALVPLALGLLTLAIAVPLPLWLGSANANMTLMALMAGALLVIVGMPLGLPVLARWVARSFARSSRPTWWLAARRLGGGSVRLARAGAFVGILVFIMGSEVSLFGATESGPAFSSAAGDRKVWSVYWDDAPEGFTQEVAHRARQEGGEGAVMMKERGSEGSGSLVVFESCAHAQSFFGMFTPAEGCRHGPGAEDVDLITDVAVQQPSGFVPGSQVLVSGPLDWDGADVLRLTSGSTAAVPMQVLGPDDDFVIPGNDWMRSGALAASALLLLGLLRTLGDRALETAEEHRALERAGLQPDEAARTTMVATLLPVAISVPIALVSAWLFAYVGGTADYTTSNYLQVAGVALLTAGGCTAVLVTTLSWQRRAAATR